MRNFTIVDVEQRSKEWFDARLGRVTGSRASDVVATLKSGGEPASRRDYRVQLALERILGRPLDDGDGYQNGDMRRGTELEPEALAAYEAATGHIVRRTGFIASTDRLIGASLDGDIEDLNGCIEIKAPRPANHLKYLRAGVMPTEHLYQLVHSQLVTGARFTDFVSFCPVFPPALQLFIVRVHRDEKQIVSYELMLAQFLGEVEKEQAEIAALRDSLAATVA